MDENSIRSKMQQAVGLVVGDIGVIRTGRATSSLVEGLELALYGGTQKLKLQEVATISTPDPQTLVIDPWDKSIIGEIRQGILAANVGMNPSIDREIIRISLPPLTTEDREKYVKLLSTKLENGRIMVRQIRSEAMHEIRKKFEAKELSEDEKFDSEKRLQALTDEYIAKIEAVGEAKRRELLNI
jgi:ribosome recycling factor